MTVRQKNANMNRIKEVLEAKGISQTELANRLGKTFNMVNLYTTNKVQPPIPILYRIADILNEDVRNLLIPNKIILMAIKGTKSDRQLNQFAVTEEFQQSNEFADAADKNICIENIFQDYGSFENVNNDKIICFNVSKTYLQCERPNLYECTRKYWRLNGERAQNADFAFAICSGYIIGVFRPTRWFLTSSKEYTGRWEFEGEEVENSPFLNMNISYLIGKNQNPVSYINM